MDKRIKVLEQRRKSSFQKTKRILKQNGCILISGYKKSLEKLEYICKCGNATLRFTHNIWKNPLCEKCRINKKKLTLEEIKKIVKEKKCILVSENYVNNKQIMEFICKCGNNYKKTFAGFQKSPMCQSCGFKILSKKMSGPNSFRWIHDREKVKKNRKFTNLCRNIVKRTLKLFEIKKDDCSSKILGYTSLDLINHIENHPNWLGVKNRKWHIDHIFPIKAFIDHEIFDLRLINCLENLQPLSKEDNLKKNDTYDLMDFRQWLKNKGIQIAVKT